MIEEIPINSQFYKFLNKHEYIISKIFDIVKQFKKDIPNSYLYSDLFPPPRKNHKYTDKLFIGCIVNILKTSCTWTSFTGPIPGKQVHKRYMEYCKEEIFEKLFDASLDSYLDGNNNINFISVDGSNIFNKQSTEITKRNPSNKNKKAAKISVIVDAKGTPLAVTVGQGHDHDSKAFNDTFDKMCNNTKIKEMIVNADPKPIFLGDPGYDTKSIRLRLRHKKMVPIIKPNNRNTKDPAKRRYLTEAEERIYKKRIKVEHYFAFVKRYPKINCVYEKTIASYRNLVLIMSSMMILMRT
jgi:hypothetical protein